MKGKVKFSCVYSLVMRAGGIDYIYIGATEDFDYRIMNHLQKLKRGVHHVEKLQGLYNQGYRPFVEILEGKTRDELINTEADYIRHFKRIEGVQVLNKIKPALNTPRRYLKRWEVLKIKELLSKGLSYKEIEKLTGIRRAQIGRIKTGQRWGKLKLKGAEYGTIQ